MEFWESNISESFWDAWGFMEGSSCMTAVFIFVVSTLLFYLGGKKWKLKKLFWDGLKGAGITVIAFVIAYFFCFFFVSPCQIYNSKNQQFKDATNEVARLQFQIHQITNNVSIKIVDWQPPELTNKTANVTFTVGKTGNSINFPVTTITNYEMTVYQYLFHRAISAHMLNKRLYINLNVPTGEMPIEIRDGKSSALPEHWDWNGDSHAFEIVDQHGQAVLQVEYLSPLEIEVLGEIQVGSQCYLTPDPNNPSSDIFPPSMFNAENDNLETIFVYPSSEHFGERLQ